MPTLALVNNQGVQISDLASALLEGAGAAVLGELILDRQLEARLRERGLTLTDDDLARERRLMARSLDVDENTGERLLNELRGRQALGPARFAALLKRNAGLRALVRERITISDEQLRQTHELLHGERRQARLLFVGSLGEASRLRREIVQGGDFIRLAVEHSTDESAARGGLLEPISRADASYPRALREALWSLPVGEVTPPIMLENGYALLRTEHILPASEVSFAAARDTLVEATRRNQERLAMEELARELVRAARVTIFDESLDWSWQTGRER